MNLSFRLIDRINKDRDILASEHRKLERKLTQGVTIGLYAMWVSPLLPLDRRAILSQIITIQFSISLAVYYDGLVSFLLSGADIWSVSALHLREMCRTLKP